MLNPVPTVSCSEVRRQRHSCQVQDRDYSICNCHSGSIPHTASLISFTFFSQQLSLFILWPQPFHVYWIPSQLRLSNNSIAPFITRTPINLRNLSLQSSIFSLSFRYAVDSCILEKPDPYPESLINCRPICPTSLSSLNESLQSAFSPILLTMISFFGLPAVSLL